MQEVCCTRCGVTIQPQPYDTNAGFLSNITGGIKSRANSLKNAATNNRAARAISSGTKKTVARATSIKKSAVASKNKAVERANSVKRKTIGSTFKLTEFKSRDELQKILNSGLTNKELTQIGKLFRADKITFKKDSDTNFEEAKDKIYAAYNKNYGKLVKEQEAEEEKARAVKKAKEEKARAVKKAKEEKARAAKEAKEAKARAAKEAKEALAAKKNQVPTKVPNSYSPETSIIPSDKKQLFLAIHPHHFDMLDDDEKKNIMKVLGKKKIDKQIYEKVRNDFLKKKQQYSSTNIEEAEETWESLNDR
jgi:hypothetical protein